jgi:hypothetical protein
LAKGTKSILMYTGIAAILVGIATFIIPYLEDAANRMIRTPDWWTHNTGAVAWFWGPADPALGLFAPFWMFAAGLIIVGILVSASSLAFKT